MSLPVEVDHVSERLVVWHCYDPQMKADLYSTALSDPRGTLLIDPISFGKREASEILGNSPLFGIILTNANHLRATEDWSRTAPLYAHPDTTRALGLRRAIESAEEQSLMEAIRIEGAAPGEIALYCAEDGGTLVMGDALINMESHGFTFLPKKYCLDAKLMRKSLQTLLGYGVARILFAHGSPIVSRAQERLAELLLADQ